jgi:two-component system chemotaxis response regulator CheV
LCVFFADDSMVARRKIAEVLDKMGVKHIQSTSGREAWDRLKTHGGCRTEFGCAVT